MEAAAHAAEEVAKPADAAGAQQAAAAAAQEEEEEDSSDEDDEGDAEGEERPESVTEAEWFNWKEEYGELKKNPVYRTSSDSGACMSKVRLIFGSRSLLHLTVTQKNSKLAPVFSSLWAGCHPLHAGKIGVSRSHYLAAVMLSNENFPVIAGGVHWATKPNGGDSELQLVCIADITVLHNTSLK